MQRGPNNVLRKLQKVPKFLQSSWEFETRVQFVTLVSLFASSVVLLAIIVLAVCSLSWISFVSANPLGRQHRITIHCFAVL